VPEGATTRRPAFAARRRSWSVCLFVALALAAFFAMNAAPADASVLVPLSLEQMSAGAQNIVYAETLSTTARFAGADSQWSGGGGTIETVVRLKVLDTVKGQGRQELTIVVPGGTVGDLTFYLDTAPRFTVGDTAVVFLDDTGQVIGGQQGKMNVVDGEVVRLKKPVSQVLGIAAANSGGEVSGRSISTVAPVKLDGKSQALGSGPVMVNLKGLSDGFESGIGNWTRTGSPTWGLTTYRSYSGSYSAYCVGSTLSPPGPYPSNANTWMIAGPFDLSTAATAAVNFQEYLATELDYDYCYTMASSDGLNFIGWGWSGDTSGWVPRTVDLSSMGSAGTNFLGNPSVWIAFVFQSDASFNYEGAYVDDVVLTTTGSGGPTPQITSINPASGSAGTGTQVTISGSNFGASQGSGRVEFFYQNSTRMSAPVVSWSATSIVCTVPAETMGGYPGSAGSGPVTVVSSGGAVSNEFPFEVTFGYGGMKQSALTCTYFVNANTLDTAGEESLFDAGAVAWNPSSAFKFVDGGSTTASDWIQNGACEVFWTYNLAPGILASTGYWFEGTTLLEADIGFNDSYTWAAGAAGTYDVQSIATHELGHWLNLRDLYGTPDSAKVMYGYGLTGVQKRSLDPDDAAGILWIYGNPAPPAISAINPTSGSTAGGTSVTITGTGFVGVTGATAVTFGGANATSYVVNSATKITAVAPAHAAGAVQVQVVATGGTTANTAAATYTFVTPAAYIRYDQTNGNIVKTGVWVNYPNPAAYLGTYGRSSTAGARATVYFTGTRIDWIGMKGATPGIVDVYLDDVKKATLDLVASPAKYQVRLWSSGTLTNTTHHMDLVRNTGSLAAEFLVLDAVDIWGTIKAGP
jgi:hypothetical protein